MRIAILTTGSRGDVQPFIALGQGLQKADHDVIIATRDEFRTPIEEQGITFAPIGTSDDHNLETNIRQGMESGSTGTIPSIRWVPNLRAAFRDMLAQGLEVCRNSNLLLYSGLGMVIGPPLGERLNIPAIAAHLQIRLATGAYPHPPFPIPPRSRLYNLLTHRLVAGLARLVFHPVVKKWLKAEGLPPPVSNGMRREKTPTLLGFSKYVVPKPKDWGDNVHLTGYWFLDENSWQPPQQLLRFLQSGPRPVYIGFGSWPLTKSMETKEIILGALALSGQRGVLGISRDRVGDNLPEHAIRVDEVPHSWLFPQMAAVVHHGGAGTIGTGLRAGVPTVTIPQWGDQPFWGQRVFEMGVGPRPLRRNKLSADRLAQAIDQVVTDETMRRNAAALGAKLRAEDGVHNAVEVIGRYLEQ